MDNAATAKAGLARISFDSGHPFHTTATAMPTDAKKNLARFRPFCRNGDMKNAIIGKTLFVSFFVPFIVLAMLTACSSLTAPNGRQRIFDVSYETVTNKLRALTISPACIIFSNAAWAASKPSTPLETFVYTTNLPLDTYVDTTNRSLETFVYTTNPPLQTIVYTTNQSLGIFVWTTNRPTGTFYTNYFYYSADFMKPRPLPHDFWFSGQELVPGHSYEFDIAEEPLETIENIGTSILVTRMDSKSTRVQIKTTHSGLFFHTRNGKIEKQRLNELSRLLSKNS